MPVYGIQNLDKRIQRMQKDLVTKLPKKLGQAAETHFRNSFKNQGFTDKALVPWRKRAKPPMTKRGKQKPHTILYQFGLLRNSVRLVRWQWNDIQVVAGGSHVPYAAIHNDGGTISKSVSVRAFDRRAHMARTKAGTRMRKEAKVRASTRRMNTVIPQRKFMGDSHVLRMEMRRIILKSIVEPLVK
ncbi:MAG: phage virion morphogenesis protein [Flavobacteriales bacterium]|nr:phage virion morphogenesis protein [Flavobacteriales bacterium]